jgi:hypothetical protein
MTKNGWFLMLPKALLHTLQQEGRMQEASWLLEYALDLDSERKYGVRYYREKWGIGGSKTERLLRVFDDALANMEASHLFEAEKKTRQNSSAKKQAGQNRDESGTKSGQTNTDGIDSKEGQSGQNRDESGTKSGRIRKEEKENKRDINISIEIPNDIDFTAYSEWLNFRAEINKPLKSQTQANKQFDQLRKFQLEGHSNKTIIDLAISSGWQGFYPPKPEATKQTPSNSQDFKAQLTQAKFISDQIKNVLGETWRHVVRGEIACPDGYGYTSYRTNTGGKEYIFFKTAETTKEAIDVTISYSA